MPESTIDKQELIELLADNDVKDAIKTGLREDAIDITDLPDATTLSGKSLPVVDDGALKAIPYATVIQTVNDAASAANAAAEAAEDAADDADAAATSATTAASSATTAAGTATTAAAQAIQAAETIPEEIEEAIADVLGGASSVDVQTVGNLLVEAGTACKITQKPYNSKSSNEAEFVKKNTAFDAYYVADSGNKIYGVTVTMGGVDISSTAVKVYNISAVHVNIASVTGAVVIEVKATKAIVFEDNAVKALCVENWGGNYIEGEITEYEAAQVTTLNSVFYNNTTITKFNELRYFTGLTSLYRSGSSDSTLGQFYGCTNLTEITIPKAPISEVRGAFRLSGLTTIDLSPITAPSINFETWLQGNASTNGPVQTVTLPQCKVTMARRMFKRARALTTIIIDGVLDVSEATGSSTTGAYVGMFEDAKALTTITGTIIGFSRYGVNVADSPLSHDSAMVLINGLSTTTANLKITFKASTYNTLTADDIAIATAKGWTVASA